VKIAIVYRVPIGPIQASLSLAGQAKDMDILQMRPNDDWATPAGKQLDDYDVIIHFHNQPPTFKTSAVILWWMCDLRDPVKIPSAGCTASAIFVCNQLYVEDYIRHFGVKTFHLPQCGNDTDMVPGRTLRQDCIFLGRAKIGESFEKSNPLDLVKLRRRILAKKFHENRLPVIREIEKEFTVRVISREGLTADQKWLYNQSPISLSISLPVPGYSSNRLYNILSSEGFALVNWFPGIEASFENRKHLVWFNSPEEARELARYYLSHPDERNGIRRAGYQLYLEKHTAASRIDCMLNEVSG